MWVVVVVGGWVYSVKTRTALAPSRAEQSRAEQSRAERWSGACQFLTLPNIIHKQGVSPPMTCSLRKCKARQGNNTYRLYLAALRWRVCINNPLISKD